MMKKGSNTPKARRLLMIVAVLAVITTMPQPSLSAEVNEADCQTMLGQEKAYSVSVMAEKTKAQEDLAACQQGCQQDKSKQQEDLAACQQKIKETIRKKDDHKKEGRSCSDDLTKYKALYEEEFDYGQQCQVELENCGEQLNSTKLQIVASEKSIRDAKEDDNGCLVNLARAREQCREDKVAMEAHQSKCQTDLNTTHEELILVQQELSTAQKNYSHCQYRLGKSYSESWESTSTSSDDGQARKKTSAAANLASTPVVDYFTKAKDSILWGCHADLAHTEEILSICENQVATSDSIIARCKKQFQSSEAERDQLNTRNEQLQKQLEELQKQLAKIEKAAEMAENRAVNAEIQVDLLQKQVEENQQQETTKQTEEDDTPPVVATPVWTNGDTLEVCEKKLAECQLVASSYAAEEATAEEEEAVETITLAPTASPTASTAPPTALETTTTPTSPPSAAATAAPTALPTATPDVATPAPTTSVATATPTTSPTMAPTIAPTTAPTTPPTTAPTTPPTTAPTTPPTVAPTEPEKAKEEPKQQQQQSSNSDGDCDLFIIRNVKFPDYAFTNHRGGPRIAPVPGDPNKAKSMWYYLRPCMYDEVYCGKHVQCVSLQSYVSPNHFIRHKDDYILVDQIHDTEDFHQDASFCMKGGFEGGRNSVSFEPVNSLGTYMTSADGEGSHMVLKAIAVHHTTDDEKSIASFTLDHIPCPETRRLLRAST